jgi:fungal nitric oxide reductase
LLYDGIFRELLDYFGALVEEKIKNPAGDLISKLVQEQLLTGQLAKEDVVQIAFLMLVAGNATMVRVVFFCQFIMRTLD